MAGPPARIYRITAPVAEIAVSFKIAPAVGGSLPRLTGEVGDRLTEADRVELVGHVLRLVMVSAEEDREQSHADGDVDPGRAVDRQRLLDTEQRRSLALMAGSMGSWEWDGATGQLTWDDGQYRICGVDPKSFIVTPDSARTLLHPDDRDREGNAYA